MELGSLGHWGEWHVKSDEGIDLFPAEDICRQYVEPYVAAFPNAKLMMRRPFSFVEEYNMGVFNDMAGAKEGTREWLKWIEKGGLYAETYKPFQLTSTPDIWEKNPVGGEFTSIYSMEEILTDRLKETTKLLDDSHMTFIGPQCPIANVEFEEYPQEVKELLNHVGYRYGVEKAAFKRNIFTGKTKLFLTVHNKGVAPLYKDYSVFLYEYDKNGEELNKIDTEIKLSHLFGSSVETYEINLGKIKSIKDLNTYILTIEDPKTCKPAILLDNREMDRENKKMVINKRPE